MAPPCAMRDWMAILCGACQLHGGLAAVLAVTGHSFFALQTLRCGWGGVDGADHRDANGRGRVSGSLSGFCFSHQAVLVQCGLLVGVFEGLDHAVWIHAMWTSYSRLHVA
eukprot:363031-Chlamydomonas_euryale.AAC.5